MAMPWVLYWFHFIWRDNQIGVLPFLICYFFGFSVNLFFLSFLNVLVLSLVSLQLVNSGNQGGDTPCFLIPLATWLKSLVKRHPTVPMRWRVCQPFLYFYKTYAMSNFLSPLVSFLLALSLHSISPRVWEMFSSGSRKPSRNPSKYCDVFLINREYMWLNPFIMMQPGLA